MKNLFPMKNPGPTLAPKRLSHLMHICRLGSLFVATLFCLGTAHRAIGQEETAADQPAAPRMTVELKSGRVFTAFVDQRSDERLLWLRFEGSSTIIMRPIEWNRVVAARFDGKKRSSTQLQASLDGLVSAYPYWAPGDPPSHLADHIPATGKPTDAQLAAGGLAADHRVKSLHVDAFVGGWDADVESDGLIVQIYPLDAQGQLVEVDATAQLSLVAVTGQRRPSPSDRARATDRQFPTIGSWTRAIDADDYNLSGATVRLPFGAVDPEFNSHIRSQALLHVRLSVPGHGMFEATTEPLTIRPINPIRNRIESVRGTRFLPIESVGR